MIATITSRTTIQNALPERTSQRLTAHIRDENGTGFKPDTLTLTLYDLATGTVINNRNRVDIRDANGGTVGSDGTVTMQFDPADMAVITDASPTEHHIAVLEWTWGTGKAGKHEIEMYIKNLAKVP